MKLTFEVFNIIANCILGLNFILYLSQFTKRDRAFKIYTLYIGVIVIIQIVSKVFVKFGYENLSVSHFYFILQFIMLSLFYLELFKEKYQKNLIKISLITIPFVIIVNLILNTNLIFKFSLLEIAITSLAIIVYSTFHFYNMLSNKKYFYFVNCGILIYIFGSSVPFLMHNLQFTYGEDFAWLVMLLNVVLYTIYQILVLIEWKVNFSKNKNE